MPEIHFQLAKHALSSISAGNSVDSVESEVLDCKEDPTRRGDRGAIVDGAVQDDRAAYFLAPELACLANHEGGVLVVGVDDSATGPAAFIGTNLDPSWLRHRIYEITQPPLAAEIVEHHEGDKRLLLMRVPRTSSSEPHSATVSKRGGRKTPRRVGKSCHDMTTIAELVAWSAERSGYDWSAQPSGRRVEAIRDAALERQRGLLRATNDEDRVALADADNQALLRRLQLLRPDGFLSQAGELLLCGSEAARIQYLARDAPGTPSVQRVEQSGRSLVEEIEQAELAVRARNRVFVLDQVGLVQRTAPAIAARTVREALINAVMHRDWDEPGPVQLDHVGDQLVVHSPGPFLDGLTSETVLMAPSRTRNRQLGVVLRSLRLAEQEGTGIDKMYVDMVRFGHEPPKIESRDGGVRVALVGGPPNAAVSDVLAKIPAKLQQDARFAVAFHALRNTPSITAFELAELLHIGEDETRAFLASTEEQDVLKRTAKPRSDGSRAWRLADHLRDSLGPVLTYFARPAEESLAHIVLLARRQGSITNQDIQDLLGVQTGRASELIRLGLERQQLALAAGAQARGRGARYVATQTVESDPHRDA